MNVKKAGEKGYFLTISFYHSDYKSTYYCEYKNGCYYSKTNDKERPVFCENGNKMIDSNGNVYIKFIKSLKK
jgi:hypothetical protein